MEYLTINKHVPRRSLLLPFFRLLSFLSAMLISVAVGPALRYA